MDQDDRKDKIVVVHEVNLGYDVEEEIQRSLKEEISEEVLEDAKDLIEAISNRPGNKKAIEKIQLEKKLEECCEIMIKDGKISKDKLCEVAETSIYAATNSMRAFAKKHYRKAFKRIGKTDDYELVD
jgi:hypothetical protein